MMFMSMIIETKSLFFEYCTFYRTYETSILSILIYRSFFIPKSSKRINNDTKNDIHPNDNNHQEKCKIKEKPRIIVIRLIRIRLYQRFSNTSSTSKSNIYNIHKAHQRGITHRHLILQHLHSRPYILTIISNHSINKYNNHSQYPGHSQLDKINSNRFYNIP